MEEKKIFKDTTLISLILISAIVIGTLLSSPTLKLVEIIATPITLFLIAQSVTKKLAEQERQAREQREKQEAFKSYLIQMTALLVDRQLAQQSHDSPISQAARALTISLIYELDEKRNQQLIEFLSNARLIQHNFNSDNSSPSLLRGANLRKCELSECNFTQADLRGCNLSNAKLNKSNFRLANLEDALFVFANLREATLDKVICNSQTSFENSNLDRAILSNIPELYKDNFNKVSLNRAELAYINLNSVDLTEQDFSQKYWKYVTFLDSELNNSNLSLIEMEYVHFDGKTSIRNSKMIKSHLTKVSLTNIDMENTDFSNSFFDMVDFSKSNLTCTSFESTKFIQLVKFDNANLAGSNLNNVDLEDASLTGAKYSKDHPILPDTLFPDDFNPETAGMIKIK